MHYIILLYIIMTRFFTWCSSFKSVADPSDISNRVDSMIEKVRNTIDLSNVSLVEKAIIDLSNAEPIGEFAKKTQELRSACETIFEPLSETLSEPLSETLSETLNKTLQEPITKSLIDNLNEPLREPITKSLIDNLSEPLSETLCETLSGTLSGTSRDIHSVINSVINKIEENNPANAPTAEIGPK